MRMTSVYILLDNTLMWTKHSHASNTHKETPIFYLTPFSDDRFCCIFFFQSSLKNEIR